jgi:tellurite methyltransferase
MRSPWAREYRRTPHRYIWGTAPSALAEELAGLLPAGARVLELGCGEGRDSVYFASRGFEVTAIDASLAGLHKAERLAGERGLRVRWVHGDMARCLPDGSFDLVYSCGAIHYVPRARRSALFMRLKSLSRPGGYHAHVVFTDDHIYVEMGERIDYFGPGELGAAYHGWHVVDLRRERITCAADGLAHEHSVERLIARR